MSKKLAEFPKWLVIIGVTLIAIGLLWQVGGKFLPLGKLPGDFIFFRGEKYDGVFSDCNVDYH